MSAVFVALPEIAVGATLVLEAFQVAGGTLSPGTLLAILATAMVLRPVVESTGPLLALSHEAGTAVDRYLDVMALPMPPEPEPTPTRRPTTGTWTCRAGVREGGVPLPRSSVR
ncbi:MAG: hypothetical protein ACRDP8_20770 [Actinopolymorphaceae bacterium]